ncbi:hypothetical protein [Streptomyces hygroscopicus]|uniref:hypothetical protein n=1 Tax=Streptomyces hygroscopicus TaxID=1912 RepID=UPI000767844B|nr:hypothetical protein [Streptomyces hygroscopicus]
MLVAGLPAVAAVKTAGGGVLGVLVELFHHPLPGDRAVDGDFAVVLAGNGVIRSLRALIAVGAPVAWERPSACS